MKKTTKLLILTIISGLALGSFSLYRMNSELKDVVKVKKYTAEQVIPQISQKEPIKILPSYTDVAKNVKIQMEIGLLSNSNPFDIKYITNAEITAKVEEKLKLLNLQVNEEEKKKIIQKVMQNLNLLNDIEKVVLEKEDKNQTESTTQISDQNNGLQEQPTIELPIVKEKVNSPIVDDFNLIKRYTNSGIELNIYQTVGESQVYSHIDGRILSVYDKEDKYLIIVDKEGVITVFAGFGQINVKAGDEIENGDVLGLTGNYQDTYQNCIILFNPKE